MLNCYKSIKYIMIIISILLCLPSVIHVIQTGSIMNFDTFCCYTYNLEDSILIRKLNWAIFSILIMFFSLIYMMIIKYRDKIFKTNKQIFIFILLISILFASIVYYLMYDIFYYMGDAWLCAKYGENPYYTTVQDLIDKGINDEILKNTGPWIDTTSVYGPVWNIISTILISLSFGNISLGLLIFKISAICIHLLNCYLITKISKNNKYLILYGLNPLILIEGLTNLHNDLYVVTFILVSLYFLTEKKNIIFSMFFLAISVATKYVTLLMVPFILLYIFKDKTLGKKILYCIFSGIGIIAIVILLYMPYYRDISIFTNMLVQNTKYCQSIQSIFLVKFKNIYNIANILFYIIFISTYIIQIVKILFEKNLALKKAIGSYNIISLIFIFLILTNFHEWYLFWIIPTIIYQNKYMKYFTLSMTICSLIYPIGFYITCSDAFAYGLTYSVKILLGSIILTNCIFMCNDLINNKKIKIEGIK